MTSKILIVDDETDVELLMKMRFRDRIRKGDYTLHFAHNGYHALEQLAAMPDLDLMLTDINMPEMDGLTLLGHVQKEYPNVQTVVVSAYGDMDNIRAAMNRGAFDFLTKPMDFQDVAITIDKALNYVRQIRESRLAESYRLAKEAAELNLQRMEEMESLREGLTQMLVHDLRTPLTSLLAGIQTVEFMGELTPDQQECVQIAVEGAEALMRMINDLLDIWKMEDSSLPIRRGPTNPAALVQSVTATLRNTANCRSQTLEFQIAEELASLHLDSSLMERVLINLLANAIKFSPDGATIHSELRLKRDALDGRALRPNVAQSVDVMAPDSLLIIVRDEGEGIPAEAHERIFDKFGQVESRRAGRQLSTGLGLTLCKMVVEAHGGCIWVESELGLGSTFLMVLPDCHIAPNV